MDEATLNDTENMLNHRLLRAAQKGDADVIGQLIRKRANLETRRPFTVRALPDMNQDSNLMGARGEGLTPLMYAAQAGHAEACLSLLDSHANIEAQDEDGIRALH